MVKNLKNNFIEKLKVHSFKNEGSRSLCSDTRTFRPFLRWGELLGGHRQPNLPRSLTLTLPRLLCFQRESSTTSSKTWYNGFSFIFES
jgi:hypothetical protein